MGLSILGWIIVGAIAGWLASVITGTSRRQGCLMDIVVGVIGGLVGGFLFGLVGIRTEGVFASLIAAIVGAVILLVIFKAIRGRT